MRGEYPGFAEGEIKLSIIPNNISIQKKMSFNVKNK